MKSVHHRLVKERLDGQHHPAQQDGFSRLPVPIMHDILNHQELSACDLFSLMQTSRGMQQTVQVFLPSTNIHVEHLSSRLNRVKTAEELLSLLTQNNLKQVLAKITNLILIGVNLGNKYLLRQICECINKYMPLLKYVKFQWCNIDSEGAACISGISHIERLELPK